MNAADLTLIEEYNARIAEEKKRADINFTTARDCQEENRKLREVHATMLAALKEVLPHIVAVEPFSDENVHWPLEEVRMAIADAEALQLR